MDRKKSLEQILRKYESYKITKAELRKLLTYEVFGRVTGVVGPFVLRYRNGKLIISNRALLFRESMSPAAVAGRNNFTAGIKFARFLNGISLIKKTWEKADIKSRTAWHSLVKYNYKSDIPDVNNTITPLRNHFQISSFCTLTDDFRIQINTNIEYDQKCTLFVIIVPFDPVSRNFDVIGLSTSLLTNEILLNEYQTAVCNRYTRYIMYTAVIRQDEDKIAWSNTIAAEGILTKQGSEKKEQSSERLYWILIHYKIPFTIIYAFLKNYKSEIYKE